MDSPRTDGEDEPAEHEERPDAPDRRPRGVRSASGQGRDGQGRAADGPEQAADLGQRAGPEPEQDRQDDEQDGDEVQRVHRPDGRTGRRNGPPGRPGRPTASADDDLDVRGVAGAVAQRVGARGDVRDLEAGLVLLGDGDAATSSGPRPSRRVIVKTPLPRSTTTVSRIEHGSTPLVQVAVTMMVEPSTVAVIRSAATSWTSSWPGRGRRTRRPGPG